MNDEKVASSQYKKDAVDVQQCVQEGRAIRDHGPFKIAIGDEHLNYRFEDIEDPVPTGRQILQLANAKPIEEYLVFQCLKNGELEELRLDETVDVRTGGVERFLFFRNDRSFRFELDGVRLEWGTNFISGATLKKLAKVDLQTYGVWLEVRGKGEDRLIGNSELVDLAAPGVERFFTGIVQTTEG